MRDSVSKMLAVSGLTLVVGPFAIIAQAQDYIDVEAERRAGQERAPETRAAASQDPYGVRPAGSYPATSYGVNTAPPGPGVGQSPDAAAPSAPQSGADDARLARLLIQLQQLQQEVMRLNGRVEEQAHEIRTLKEQSLERYVDIDRRLGAMAGGGASAASGAGSMPVPSGAEDTPNTSTGAANVSEQPGEGDAYRAAYALVRSQQFDEAVKAFESFLRQYPAGRYAPNAHYWLGELYLVQQPADLESSRQAFTLLLDEYPDSTKVPDALYKLGRVHYMKGNRERAREYLDRVIREHGSHAAARLAQDFIDENY